MVHYVTDLQNEDSEVSEDANELYISLQEETEDLRQEGIQQCSQFIMDLLMHILLGHYDPAWLFQNKSKLDLSNRLSKQKEREKTIHLKTLTDVSKDERYLADMKQKIGVLMMKMIIVSL